MKVLSCLTQLLTTAALIAGVDIPCASAGSSHVGQILGKIRPIYFHHNLRDVRFTSDVLGTKFSVEPAPDVSGRLSVIDSITLLPVAQGGLLLSTTRYRLYLQSAVRAYTPSSSYLVGDLSLRFPNEKSCITKSDVDAALNQIGKNQPQTPSITVVQYPGIDAESSTTWLAFLFTAANPGCAWQADFTTLSK